jgi:programmed cell death protein 5
MIENELSEFESVKKDVMRKILTRDAIERIGRIRVANPLVATQLEVYLFQLYQSGKLKETIDDKKLKQILEILVPERKKIKIKRK